MTTSPIVPLKLGAVVFAMLWGGWMYWSSGPSGGGIVLLAVCAAEAGYAWYRIMRWSFRRMHMLPADDSPPVADHRQ